MKKSCDLKKISVSRKMTVVINNFQNYASDVKTGDEM